MVTILSGRAGTVEGMADAPDTAALENAIRQYLVAMSASEMTGECTTYVKVDLRPTDTGATTGVLFLSMPHLGGDTEWLTKLMAYVREGFERDAIPSQSRVTVGEDERFETFRDEDAGTVLLNLPAHLTVEPR